MLRLPNQHTFGSAMRPTSDNIVWNQKAEALGTLTRYKNTCSGAKLNLAIVWALPTIGEYNHWSVIVPAD